MRGRKCRSDSLHVLPRPASGQIPCRPVLRRIFSQGPQAEHVVAISCLPVRQDTPDCGAPSSAVVDRGGEEYLAPGIDGLSCVDQLWMMSLLRAKSTRI
jgi:hypothetical protein